jgi:hypothetical protein
VKLVVFACTLAMAASGCKVSASDDGDSPSSRSESLIEALTRAVRFEDGKREEGEIEELDPAAKTVQLDSADSVLSIKAGGSSIMALDVDNPTDDGVVATLMQFEGAESHTEVPLQGGADGGSAGEDGGTGNGKGTLHIENPFEVDDDVCAHLCAKRYTAQLKFAVKLKGGAVSKQGSIEIALDCSKKGDPDLCDDTSSGERKDAGSASGSDRDAGSSGAETGTGSGRDGGSKPGMDGGTSSTGRDAAAGKDASSAASDGGASSGELAPQIGPITPDTVTASTALTLTIAGSGFLAGAKAYVDGSAVATAVSNEMQITAEVAASSTAYAGSLAVYVENVPGDASTRSNVLYLTVTPAAGAPIIYDYSPDNGVAGDKILIIASNLAAQTLTITDANGTALTPGAIGTISWPNAGSADTVEITLPADAATGPITVGNEVGSYKGKILSVGLNLTRAAGTTLESSTQYNTGNWSTVSGGDNSLASSFFTAHGDCATATTCTTKPFYQITFADAQTIGRIAMRGNREYASGYDFISGKFEVLDDGGAVLWSGDYDLPAPDRDLDITLPEPVSNARSVKFTSTADESDEPGFSEIEVFAP